MHEQCSNAVIPNIWTIRLRRAFQEKGVLHRLEIKKHIKSDLLCAFPVYPLEAARYLCAAFTNSCAPSVHMTRLFSSSIQHTSIISLRDGGTTHHFGIVIIRIGVDLILRNFWPDFGQKTAGMSTSLHSSHLLHLIVVFHRGKWAGSNQTSFVLLFASRYLRTIRVAGEAKSNTKFVCSLPTHLPLWKTTIRWSKCEECRIVDIPAVFWLKSGQKFLNMSLFLFWQSQILLRHVYKSPWACAYSNVSCYRQPLPSAPLAGPIATVRDPHLVFWWCAVEGEWKGWGFLASSSQ